MTWVKIDDKLTSHPKWLQLTLPAKSLWFHSAVWCGAHNTDGIIPEHALPLIGFTASLTPAQIAPSCDDLVRVKLWKRRPKKDGGGFEIKDWLHYQPSRQQVLDKRSKQEAKDERERLHDWLHKSPIGRRVKAVIIARDGTTCRYCNTTDLRTDGDRRSLTRRTFDLIDPASINDFQWDGTPLTPVEIDRIAQLWVVACGWCNATKNNRTPAEASMEILPAQPHPPIHRDPPRSAATGSRTNRELGTDQVGPGRDGPVRDGTGQDGQATSTNQEPVRTQEVA